MFDSIPIITIDGPSGTGKGTISRLLAKELGWHMLDSGAMYRVLALQALNKNYSLDDDKTLVQAANNLDVEFLDKRIFLERVDVTSDIRSEKCGETASIVAAKSDVRTALLARQRAFAVGPGLVADGRDMGTVVFVNAILKVYLDASAEERAKRRYLQLKEAGHSVNLQDLAADIMQRDVRDKTRAVAPLRPAEDAVIIDTSDMGIDSVLQQTLDLARQRLSD